MKKNLPAKSEFLIYRTDNGETKVEVRLEDENIWLTQQMMAELFQTTQQNISQHIQNIINEGELTLEATHKKFLSVQQEGKRQVSREKAFYNLDMIISVGYRVKSIIATRFRIWATARLKEYIIKGYVLDDDRLKHPPQAGSPTPDYFDELLARIRDIRASEKRMYLRVREIFALASDYEPSTPETNKFFSIIQNKLHFAATGQTAAEIIHTRAKATLPNMGLTTWQKDEVGKTDITVAKNYLNESEITELNRIVTMWLDFAEDQAKRRKQIFMKNWETKLNDFLAFNDRSVFIHSGSISKQDAEEHAKREYEDFSRKRRELKEQQGEADSIRMLEQAAKQIEESSENQ